MTRSVCGLILGIAAIMVVGVLAVWLLRSHAPAGADPGIIDLVERSMDTAEDARRSERDVLMAADRYWLVGIALAAGLPLVIALLILRECGRREPRTEEIVSEVSRCMLDEQRQKLSGGAKRPELPTAQKKKLAPPT